MRKPIFILSDYPNPNYPVQAESKSLCYHNVYPSSEIAIECLTARFGTDIIIKDKTTNKTPG